LTGGEDDDRGGDDLRRVLAAVPHLFHHLVAHARDQRDVIHPGAVPGHLLAGHVQFHVQPNHLLLDELQVPSAHFQ
jgi:hypothetical protein